MVDEEDSKSFGVTLVWVRVPPPAPKTELSLIDDSVFMFSPVFSDVPLKLCAEVSIYSVQV